MFSMIRNFTKVVARMLNPVIYFVKGDHQIIACWILTGTNNSIHHLFGVCFNVLCSVSACLKLYVIIKVGCGVTHTFIHLMDESTHLMEMENIPLFQ